MKIWDQESKRPVTRHYAQGGRCESVGGYDIYDEWRAGY